MPLAGLPATLQAVTATKIAELGKQEQWFNATRDAIKAAFDNAPSPREKSWALITGVCKLEGVRIVYESQLEDTEDQGPSSKESDEAFAIVNYMRILRQAWLDPSFSRVKLDEIHVKIFSDLQLKSDRHAQSRLYSELVAEWITHEFNAKPPRVDASPRSDSNEGSESYELVGRKAMFEQRCQWESLVYSNSEVDAEAVKIYLQKLFTKESHVKRAYTDIKKKTRTFSFATANSDLCTPETLKKYIKGLLATDLLGEEKRGILKTFSDNKEVLDEVSDVLNMRYKSLDSWQWTLRDGAVTLEQRRQLNGKYRVFMDEDVLDALMLHAIGMKWAMHFRSVFFDFFHSFAWTRSRNKIPIDDRKRREWFLDQKLEDEDNSVQKHRHDDYAERYFLTQLPDDIDSASSYDDGDSDDKPKKKGKNPLEKKHSLLHLLLTEALLAHHLHPDNVHSVIRSDFKWFGPSLSHATIFAVLEFFGVNDQWLLFFRKFLCAPMRFSQDGPTGEIRTRSRGLPMSHMLADVFSESVLFVMDFAVNASTGANLYRLHDDFWFWGPHSVCETAWKVMHDFAKTMGIEFNESKTGSAVFPAESSDGTPAEKTESTLPDGDVRWGLLRLDPNTTSFKIDQEMVDEHVKELRLQLKATKSVIGYIQAYNAYLVRFFSNNLGKPCFASGRDHIMEMVDTFARIQSALFPEGRVVDHLSTMTAERFNVSKACLPDGFWFFPMSFGGMELRNPVVPLFAMREEVRRRPARILQRALEKDETAYLTAEKQYQKKNSGYGLGKGASAERLQISDSENFMSKAEFLRYREERSANLLNAYKELLRVPDEEELSVNSELKALVGTIKGKCEADRRLGRKGYIQEKWSQMDPYWQWIVAVYGEDVKKQYGSLALVDSAQIPWGIIGLIKATKVRWQV